MNENIPPPYKDTKCKSCGEVNKPLFARMLMRDDKDYYCKSCMDDKKHL